MTWKKKKSLLGLTTLQNCKKIRLSPRIKQENVEEISFYAPTSPNLNLMSSQAITG